MSQLHQLDFTQAMQDFKVMFPEMDSDVIEAVLRSNQGAVDATIDALLTMSTDNQNEQLMRQEQEKDLGKTDTPKKISSSNQTIPVSKSTSVDVRDNISPKIISGASPKIKKIGITTNNYSPSHTSDIPSAPSKWKPPILAPLPASFLRLSNDPRIDFDLGDEQFATMLQNEEFMAELRWNEEFLSALEKDQGKVQDEKSFEERLRHMGKVSRKKFTQLARVFTWQRNKKTSAPKHVRHPDSLLLQESDDEETGARVTTATTKK